MSLRIRRGGGDVEGGGGAGPIFGPTLGAAAVRSGAGARTVTNPGGGISFNSSSSLQTAINNNAAGSTFVCSSNAPVWNGQVDTGTKAPTIIFPGAVGQCVIECNNGQFFPIVLGINSTLRGGTWQNAGTASTIHGVRMAGDNSTVQDAVVSGMYDSGIAPVGNGCTISHCTMHDNGQDGYGGATGDDITLEFCEVYGNNTRQVNPGNEGGAGKIVSSVGGWYHHNWLHDNLGFGMWWDTACRDILIEENVSEDNWRAGGFYEANDKSVIRHNLSINNGRAATIGGQGRTHENCVQFRIADSNCVTGRGSFEFNLLDYTLGGADSELGMLMMLWDHTGTVARSCQNWDIHDNQMWCRTTFNQRVGGQDTATGSFPVWANNSFFNNQYRVASNTVSYWKWDTGTGGGVAKTFTEWQGFHSGETRSLI